MAQNPLKAIFDVKREELPMAILMGLYFFLVITSFWILKPIKKSIFIGYYEAQNGLNLLSWHLAGPQAELLAKVLNMVVAAVAVTIFTILARRFVRQQLTTIFSIFFVACYLIYSFLLPSNLDQSGQDWTIWSFYLFGDLFSTLMVATFFAFLNDSFTPDSAKRLYGIVGFGGVAGGALGSTTVRALIEDVSNAGWMLILVAIALVITGIAIGAGRRVDRTMGQSQPREAPQDTPKETTGNPAFEGAKLVFSSGYLLVIVGIVGMYEMVSTIMDFQFTATIVHYLEGAAIGKQFSTVFAITNWVAMFVQLLLTSFVMSRFGIGIALLFLPMAALLGSTGFLIAPILLFGSALNTTDNGFSYSINQSAKEALYVPTTKDEKYKAKAFIDMFVQRFAKAIAVGLSLGITTVFAEFSSIRWLSIVTVLILIGWIATVRYTGRRFEELTSQ